jgi:diphthine-ammonia ligase
MTNNKPFLSSWSGGKDSCFAFMKALELGMTPKMLLNMMNENGKISRSHGIPEMILHRQAGMLNLPITTVPTTWNDYELKFIGALKEIKEKEKVETAVFGDIDLQPHRDWEEKVCALVGIEAFLPLWQKDRKTLVLEMLQAGIKTAIVSCNEVMGISFLGRIIDEELVEELESIGIDACGENGEYHTLVLNCPLFENEIMVEFGERVNHNNYWFIQMS